MLHLDPSIPVLSAMLWNMDQHYSAVTLGIKDSIATILLNRPEQLNAWNNEISEGLDNYLLECDRNDSVRAVLISGTGRAFCAGADLSGGSDTFDPDRERDLDDDSEARTSKLLPHQISKPVIAAINGPAVGVGATYPLTCDIRIASSNARIGFVFNRIGMLPELGSHSLLPMLVGFGNASRLLMSAEIIDAQTALAMGLVSAVYESDELLDRAIALAQLLSSAAPVSVAATKRLLWAGLGKTWAEMHAAERPVFDWIGKQADAAEGIRAFLEKRPPEWSMSSYQDLPDDLFD